MRDGVATSWQSWQAEKVRKGRAMSGQCQGNRLWRDHSKNMWNWSVLSCRFKAWTLTGYDAGCHKQTTARSQELVIWDSIIYIYNIIYIYICMILNNYMICDIHNIHKQYSNIKFRKIQKFQMLRLFQAICEARQIQATLGLHRNWKSGYQICNHSDFIVI